MWVTYTNYGRIRELFRSPGFPDRINSEQSSDKHQRSYRFITVQTTHDQMANGQVNLTLAVPDWSLRQDASQLRWVFGLGWLLSLVMAFSGGYVVAGFLLKPIQRIVNQANKIDSASVIEPILLPDSRDELYQLTDTLNRMLARIRESADQQRNFFGAAAHELRTPLAVMKTGLEVTLGSGLVDSRTTPFLIGQLDEVSRLTRLLDEFLTLSRPENSSQPLKRTPVDPSELIKKCLNQLETVAADYEVTTQFDDSVSICQPLQTDAVKLEHIVLNLIENAIKYAVSGDVVRVQLQCTETWTVRVQNQTVRETGPTLDLMQPYFQADPLKEGHGLGLWISHRLTMLLSGELGLNWQDFTFTSTLRFPTTSTY
jgi:signal transduction histidine kinase